ncbi:MAG: putative oxidoreductase Fe-S binding subunit [Methanomassiliicoccales archaeon PtaU1.Bin124]|nr:MAG: putative oxidoreductase Fe-S binding subunit [Methanomassiliicoccales archaeon PtaU1.Bin124]
MSEVYFSNLRASSDREKTVEKVSRLFKRAKLADAITDRDLVAIKLHFGESGNTAFLRPQLVQRVVELVEAEGGRPFLTDSNTLYVGSRSNAVDHLWTAARHGFTYPVVNAPVVIADGLKGNSQVEVDINQKHCRTAKIGAAAMEASAVMCVTHLKGHMMTGFGGAMKNLGMGFGSRAGKLEMHSGMRPKVNESVCRGCGNCASHCPGNAIQVKERKSVINEKKCIGCGECLVVCQFAAMEPSDWTMDTTALQEKVVEYCYAITKGRKEKFGYITFIMDVSPYCDCASWSDVGIVPNVGILASKDIVSIDQASADLVNKQMGARESALTGAMKPGEDKFRNLYDFDWHGQLEYAEKLGLGERDYKLIQVK